MAGNALSLGEALFHLAAYHKFNQVILGHIFCRLGGDDFAVPHHRHSICNKEKFLQPVRNINTGDTMLLKRSQDFHQLFDFRFAESTGRLVQDQDLGVLRESFGDLDHLHFTHPQIINYCPRINIQLILRQDRLRIGIKFIPDDRAMFHWFFTQVNIFANRSGWDQG